MTSHHEAEIEGNRLTVDLYVCASTCGTHEKQRTILGAVEDLVEAGVVDEFERHLWPGRITTTDDDAWCTAARETYDEFASWARSEGRSLGPAFTRREVRNEFSDQEYEVIRFPLLTLAVRADDDVVRLAPSGETERHYSVDDCLTELRGLERREDRPPTLEP